MKNNDFHFHFNIFYTRNHRGLGLIASILLTSGFDFHEPFFSGFLCQYQISARSILWSVSQSAFSSATLTILLALVKKQLIFYSILFSYHNIYVMKSEPECKIIYYSYGSDTSKINILFCAQDYNINSD